MKVLGQQVDLLLLMQLAVTAMLLFSYSVLRALRSAFAEQSGDAQTVLLIDFVLGHSKKDQSLPDLLGIEEDVLIGPAIGSPSRAATIASALKAYQEHDVLPSRDDYSDFASELKSAVWVIPIAPLASMVGLHIIIQGERKYKTNLIDHTDIRKANSSGMFALLVVCAAYLFFSLSLLAQNSGSWAVVLGILAIMNSIGAACALGALLSLIRQQYYWKGYWQERLFEIMASAKGDHDLFNRCIILRREIASEPDVPIPGAVTTYVVLFSAIQTVLLWVSHRVSWL